ncbi:hypothetical protein HDU93_002342 [Gonapodya sp. JEL0774]|nr:hypothetical protein HDU93_002342 [Gonapodya sp. JEL0774]
MTRLQDLNLLGVLAMKLANYDLVHNHPTLRVLNGKRRKDVKAPLLNPIGRVVLGIEKRRQKTRSPSRGDLHPYHDKTCTRFWHILTTTQPSTTRDPTVPPRHKISDYHFGPSIVAMPVCVGISVRGTTLPDEDHPHPLHFFRASTPHLITDLETHSISDFVIDWYKFYTTRIVHTTMSPALLVPITAVYSSVLGLIHCALIVTVGRGRGKFNVSLGDSSREQALEIIAKHGVDRAALADPLITNGFATKYWPLMRRIRAQANFAETAPFALIISAMAELNGAPEIGLHVLLGLFTVDRLWSTTGILLSDSQSTNNRRNAAVTGLVLVLVGSVWNVLRVAGVV